MIQFDNIPLTVCFKEYNGSPDSVYESIEFIKDKYKEVDKEQRYIRFTHTSSNAFDASNDRLWKDIQRGI